MKPILKFAACILLTWILIFASCKKEHFCENCAVNPPGDANKHPIANAGSDQIITLPTDSVLLDGSASYDPDGIISSFQWTKISGPASFNIANANVVQTLVTDLVQGVYQFELKVTDAGGLFSIDTVQVSINPEPPPPPTTCNPGVRPLINAQLLPFGTLSQARNSITIGAADNKILFAGGIKGYGPQTSSRVDIYDINSNAWSTAELSQARYAMASVTLGNKIYFAGGCLDGGNTTSRIDIYDVSTNAWSTAELSQSRKYIAAGQVGNKIFFAGGELSYTQPTNRVDIYDSPTNTWSVDALSVAREGITATTAGNKIYFAGGDCFPTDFVPSSIIDIYDVVSNSWTTDILSESKVGHAAIAVNNKIYWAGGNSGYPSYWSGLVEIRDITTQTSTFACLFQPNTLDAVLKNNKIVFYSGGGGDVKNKFDIYDVTTNAWSIGVLNRNIEPAAIISVNNTIYVAGEHVDSGWSDQVWKLEF